MKFDRGGLFPLSLRAMRIENGFVGFVAPPRMSAAGFRSFSYRSTLPIRLVSLLSRFPHAPRISYRLLPCLFGEGYRQQAFLPDLNGIRRDSGGFSSRDPISPHHRR